MMLILKIFSPMMVGWLTPGNCRTSVTNPNCQMNLTKNLRKFKRKRIHTMNSIQNELDYLNQLKFSVSQFLYDIDEPTSTGAMSDEQIFSLTENRC